MKKWLIAILVLIALFIFLFAFVFKVHFYYNYEYIDAEKTCKRTYEKCPCFGILASSDSDPPVYTCLGIKAPCGTLDNYEPLGCNE